MANYGLKRTHNMFEGNLGQLDLNVEPKGWFLGSFINEIPEFNNKDFELKWGDHKKGFIRDNVKSSTSQKTILLLISGKFRLDLPDDNASIILETPGDYVYFDKQKSEHNFEALEDCKVLTIRWPSKR